MTPDVERLCGRLAATPSIFLAPVDPSKEGFVQVSAVVADLFRARADREPLVRELDDYELPARTKPATRKQARRHLRTAMLACWLLHDETFAALEGDALHRLLGERLRALSKIVAPSAFLDDPDRREELVRVCLDALGIAPAGERLEDAEDRLTTLDSVHRKRLLAEARQREEERERRRRELDALRRQEEEARRQAAKTTYED